MILICVNVFLRYHWVSYYYLIKQDINSIDITHLINKDKNMNKGQNYIDNQMYVICSKKETLLSQFK